MFLIAHKRNVVINLNLGLLVKKWNVVEFEGVVKCVSSESFETRLEDADVGFTEKCRVSYLS